VDRARVGNREALGDLYDLYLTRVYRYVLAHVGRPAEAEDITAEIFLRLVENIGRFEWQGVPFSAWLFRIARNQVITHHRKKGGRPGSVSVEEFDVEDSRPGPEWHVEQRITTEEVFDACQQLPSSQRQVISLRFGAGLSVKETADSLGKTENNVKVLQHKAIAKLQRLLRS
jgi:RNA polymerase sigma-70 factor (ECF subfamily)